MSRPGGPVSRGPGLHEWRPEARVEEAAEAASSRLNLDTSSRYHTRDVVGRLVEGTVTVEI